MSEQKFRLVTRSDFDGLICAVLLKHRNMLDDVLFVHPKDMQDGKIEIGPRDITTNLPYVPGCHLAFDHHASETVRLANAMPDDYIIDANAPSAARVVFEYFGGESAFPREWSEMMDAVDKADSAKFSREEVMDPTGWVLLNYLMDARTGLGRFRDFTISNYQLMMRLIDACTDMTIDEILELDDVQERVDMYFSHEDAFKEQIRACSTVHGSMVVLDLRDEEIIYCGNRFMIYALYPECDISMHVLWGLRQENTVFAIGKSILDRGSKVNVGELCLDFGGGGHANAGTCQVSNDDADRVQNELVERVAAAEREPA